MQKQASKILVLFLLLCTCLFVKAQPATSNTNTDEAVWIKMIDDPNVNYYVAVKAYEDYWKTHEKPADPEDRLGDNNLAEKNETSNTPVTKEEKIYEARMIYQMKRFEAWMREEKPFVQEDGRILSQDERIAIWKKQHEGK
jgi:hypothetical protein